MSAPSDRGDVRAAARASGLATRLRVLVLTAPKPACGRPLLAVIGDCIVAGATAIQIRDKDAGARELVTLARATRTLVDRLGTDTMVTVDDRLDVALAAGCDGVHLGPEDLPLAAARRLAPRPFVLGYSTDDPVAARRAAAAGADYLGVGAVYGTRSKPGLEHEAIGPARVRAVREASRLPCVGIGGIDVTNAAPVFATGAGVAVLSSVMHAADPAAEVRRLVALSTDVRPRM